MSSSGSVRCYCVLGKTRLLLFLYLFFLFNKFLIYIFVVFFLFCFTSYYSLEWREQLRVCFCLFVFYVLFVKFTYSARYYSKLKQSGNRSPCSRPWESESKELKRTKKTCAGNTLCLHFMFVCVCVSVWVWVLRT